MAEPTGILGLVELADADDLAMRYDSNVYSALHENYRERMKGWVRDSDEWMFLPDNRFCVVLDGVKSEAQLRLATAKLERLFEEPYHGEGNIVPLEVNAGFVEASSPSVTDEGAIRCASVALQKAKAGARLFEVYKSDDDEEGEDRLGLIRKLQSAVELGELELYFQPKVHAGYRSLIGAEALMRWHTADGRVVGPDEFISVAETHDVIRPMTWWALKSAIARLARWPEELSMAVNITPSLLLDDEILIVVRDSLDVHGVGAHRLILEVTENVMISNQMTVLPQLHVLRDLGVRVSIDDFGTGYSSLAYFRDLPADEIKIDRCFVMPMLESEKDHAIVKAVIDLAHNFSLRVVAEGVETEAIAQRLAELRCDVLQGYVFDKPLLLQDFELRYLRR
jgi:EAL domain-containing protein (putative c-di-GMP-specific phosphodiesterase class I)